MIETTSNVKSSGNYAEFKMNNARYLVDVIKHHSLSGGVSMNTIVLPNGEQRKVNSDLIIYQDGNESTRKFRCIHPDKRVTYHRNKPERPEKGEVYVWMKLDWVRLRP